MDLGIVVETILVADRTNNSPRTDLENFLQAGRDLIDRQPAPALLTP